jgi:hypothetical protein
MEPLRGRLAHCDGPFKDGSTDQLGKTNTVSLDNPVPLH